MTEVMEFGSHVGRVMRFYNRKGFGFIHDLNDNKDYFVHNSDIVTKEDIYRKLYPGEYVSYDTQKQTDGREKCVNVRGIMGYPLLTENEEHSYRVFVKDNDAVNKPTYNDEDSTKVSDSDDSDDSDDKDESVDASDEPKEVINKEAPEGIEVADFDGLNINEEMG